MSIPLPLAGGSALKGFALLSPNRGCNISLGGHVRESGAAPSP